MTLPGQDMRNPHVIWAMVSIVFMLIAGSVTLAVLDKDVTVILTLAGLVAVPVLGAFGVAVYHKLDQVKEISNGKSDVQMTMIKDLQDKITNLALLVPAISQSEPDKADGDYPQEIRLSDQELLRSRKG